MRIVHVVLSLGLGGQERLVVDLARALAARGHDAHVVSFSSGGALRSELEALPIHEVRRREGLDPGLVMKLTRLFRSLAPDVVHTHNAAPLVYAAPAARLARITRLVHTKHGEHPYRPGALGLVRATSRLVSDFVAVSPETATAAAKTERPRPERLRVIANGIPLDAFRPDPVARVAVRAELGIPQDAVVVGLVARLAFQKNQPLLVRAAAPLLSPRVRLVLVGDGPERAATEAAIPHDARRFVVMAGVRKDVARVLSSFDVFASSSRWEGLPLAVTEAMTAGLPIVSTAVGGVVGILPEGAGILVPPGDERALRDALARLVGDAALRARMGRAAQTHAQAHFAQSRMVEGYLALYGRPVAG